MNYLLKHEEIFNLHILNFVLVTISSAEAEFPILMRSYWILRDPTVQYNIAAADIVGGRLTSGFGGDRGGVAEVGQRT